MSKKTFILGIFLPIICVFVLGGCGGNSAAEQAKTVYAMDTVMTLKAYDGNAEKALEEAEQEIMRLDNMLRRGSSGSEIYELNSSGEAEVSEETAELIEEALRVCLGTGGAFDISVAPIMDLWGFYTKDFRVPAPEEIDEALQAVSFENISVSGNRVVLRGGAQIDLGGIAKGYASDRVAEIFKDNGVTSGIVSLGGNVQAIGQKKDGSKWRVALQSPDSAAVVGEIAAADKAVVTSGSYQRYFESGGVRYHHIIDPKTGYPAGSGVKSVTIVCDRGTVADGLSTALFVMGLDKGAEYWKTHEGFEVIFITDDNQIYITEGLKDDFESPYEYSLITR